MNEMISVELTHARSVTTKIFTAHINSHNLDEFYSTLSEDEKFPIRLVLSFFRRLQLAIEYNRINEKIAIDLLSREFLEWYHMWLNHLVPSHWTTRNQVDKLHKWVQDRLSRSEYERVKGASLESRNKLLARSNED